MTKSKWFAAALLVSAVSLAGDDMPWVFNNGEPGQGYSITFVNADPAPGTPLLRGSSVTIKLNVTYTMSAAPEGKIFLVLQDEKNNKIEGTKEPATVDATSAGGPATLSVTIPAVPKAREVRIFVPIFPKGLESTSGEILLRYPIRKK
jgi:hypothetical protein